MFCCVCSHFTLLTITLLWGNNNIRNTKLFSWIYSILHIFLLRLSSTLWPLSQSPFKLAASVCVVQLNGILLLLLSFTRSIPFSLHIYGLLLLLFVSSFGVFLSPCEYALLQCVRVCLSLEFFTFGIHLMAHDKKHYTIHIYTEMSIDSLTLSSTLCTAAMHIGSHSIHYTAMKQASKQTNTEHNKTRLHSVWCGFVVRCFTRECSINARSVCCILCYMLLSFFPPFSLLHHTQHSIDAPQRPLVFAVVCVLQFVFI